jgi:hypothetical protein
VDKIYNNIELAIVFRNKIKIMKSMKFHILAIVLTMMAAKKIVDPKQILTEIDESHNGKTFLDAI